MSVLEPLVAGHTPRVEAFWQKIQGVASVAPVTPQDLDLATQSYFAESGGMTAAARLVTAIKRPDLQIAMAEACCDEACHATAFRRFVEENGGQIGPASEDTDEILGVLENEQDTDALFFYHYAFESFAVEEFRIFMDCVDNTQLREIYRLARLDEARHVSLGIHYFRAALSEGRISRLRVQELSEIALQAADLGAAGYNWLASISGRKGRDIQDIFHRSYEANTAKILS